MKKQSFVPLSLLCLLGFAVLQTEAAPDPQVFVNPPAQYSVGTWWHWLNGNISKEGITKDLQAMREQGINRATIFDASMAPLGPVTPMLGDSWFEMLRHAATEANRVGVKLGMHACPGWSEAGGPWITPENSMKRLVWSQTIQTGGQPLDLELPPLPGLLNWSKDIAVLAWPTTRSASRMAAGSVISNGTALPDQRLWDGNPNTSVDCNTPDGYKWDLAFSFPSEFEADRLRLQLRWKSGHPPVGKVTVQISGDGQVLKEVEIAGKELENVFVLPFDPARVREFKVAIKIVGKTEPWTTFNGMQITEAELLHGGELPQWDPELQNIFQQLGDSGAVGEPAWSKETKTSTPIDPKTVINLGGFVKNGRIRWSAPAGNWQIVRFGYTTTGQKNGPSRSGGQGLESDKMDASATELHFRSYVKRVLDGAGDQRKAFDLLLMDSWEAGKQNWTGDFAAEFGKRRGYDILPYLPVAAGQVVGSREETSRFLNDFRQTISDLLVERFYQRMGSLAHEEGLQLAAELGGGPDMDIFAVARAVDQPMTEFWSDKSDGSLPPVPAEVRTDMVADAAFLANKPVVPTESFTAWQADFSRTPGDFGYLADLEFCKGFNGIVLHSFVHQQNDIPPGLTLAHHGQAFNRLNTWWPMAGDWLRSLARAQYLLQPSQPVYDVLVYCGDSMPGATNIGGLPEGTRRLRIDHDTLMHRVKMLNGRLTLDGQGDYAGILFPSGNLLAETAQKILSLAQEGASVAVPPRLHNPSWSDHAEQDRQLEVAARQILGDAEPPVLPRPVGKGMVYAKADLGRLFGDRGYQPDFSSSPTSGGRPLLTYHKKNAPADLFLLFNPNDNPTAFTCSIVDSTSRLPELWQPATGKVVAPTGYLHEKGRLQFSVTLEGKSSVFLVMRNAVPPNAAPALPAAAPRELALKGAWKVTFQGLPGVAPLRMEQPVSWTENSDPRIRNYSGIAVYETEFALSPAFLAGAGSVQLDLGEVGRIARVTVNGHPAGTLWKAPWQLDIGSFLKKNNNSLKIEVANTWLNRLLADTALPPTERSTWTTWDTKWWTSKNVSPEKSGLLSGLRLLAQPQ